MRISVIIPSKGCTYLRYALFGLREQVTKPNETILVIKECNAKYVEELCSKYNLRCMIIEQEKGYVTHALNLAKKEANGDIMLFTDDDAIPTPKWVEKYLSYHRSYPGIVGISSRDIYIDLRNAQLMSIPDDKPNVRLYRWLIRPWLEPPHPCLKKYRLGVYISKTYGIVHGLGIPNHVCFSLPFRGVNMSFKSAEVSDIWFPESNYLKRAIGFEQYFGVELIVRGYDSIYTPNNPVLHIAREESLSRARGRKTGTIIEYELMRELIRKALSNGCGNEYA